MRTLDAAPLQHLELLLHRYPLLQKNRSEIVQAYFLLESCFQNQGKLLIAGNGGSAADADHIVGELMKSFKKPRTRSQSFSDKLSALSPEWGDYIAGQLQGALPAIALDGHPALSTAFLNDTNGLLVFAQQLSGYGVPGDVFLALSTSGNSQNLVFAALVARALDMPIISMTGEKESRLSEISDVTIRVPATETYQVQELHLPVYHCLCLMLEAHFFPE